MRYRKRLLTHVLKALFLGEPMRNTGLVLLLLGLLNFTTAAVVAEPSEPEQHAPVSNDQKGSKSAQPRFNGFAKFRKGFQAICEQVYLDGRGDRLAAMLKAGPIEGEGCLACRSLFSDFALACRAPKAKPAPKPKKDEPPAGTPTPIYRQRDPSAKAIEFSLTVFRALSEHPEVVLVSQATDQLFQRLSERGDKTPAEYDYFLTLVSYMRAPFAQTEKPTDRREVAPRPTIDVDALFE